METIEAVGKEQSVEELEKVRMKIKLQPITMRYFRDQAKLSTREQLEN